MPAKARTDRNAVTRGRILDAAERLFAEHGVHGVSNRQVAEAAGQGNTAVVGYHFGTKTDLVRAIVHRHSAAIERTREQMVARIAGSDDLRDWLEEHDYRVRDEVVEPHPRFHPLGQDRLPVEVDAIGRRGRVPRRLLADRSSDVDAGQVERVVDAEPRQRFVVGELLDELPLRRGVAARLVDRDRLAVVIARVARLAELLPQIAEMDLNPVICTPDACRLVDARVRVVPTVMR